jgi:rubrerythrin
MYDLDDDIEKENQDSIQNELDSKVYKKLKENKRFISSLSSKKDAKEKVKLKVIKNQIHYVCCKCDSYVHQSKGTIITTHEGDFAYCPDCLKKYYPNYKKVFIQGLNTQNKFNYRDNDCDNTYSKGMY